MYDVKCPMYSSTVGIILFSLQFQNILAIHLKNFALEPCNNIINKIGIENIALSSNGSAWTVSAKLSVGSTLDAPIMAQIKMERRIFYRWVKIPCVGNFGSCQYTDICDLADKYENCKDKPGEKVIPCKCPISQGDYEINMDLEHSVMSRLEPALKGNYRALLKMMKNDETIVCYNIKFKLSS
ncbi:ganglioside GM2 activator-like [Macrosteles quadrilineatus]|uniref:ganglioside GM2 activator-like n=1 Tax=Macrosteles quadrilineatus TaxID=74068 RepID=UPI0023E0EE33|nr:ganglioside GM2 activator-like [Macrosteles quadrilineatus]